MSASLPAGLDRPPASTPPAPAPAHAAVAARRAGWLRQLTLWHWISSAVSLVGMLFFALTGITLNHADSFEQSTPAVMRREAVLPPPIVEALRGQRADDEALPAVLDAWLREQWRLASRPGFVERSTEEVFVDLRRPGVDAALSIALASGRIVYEETDRGWIAWLNELHRGRNAGPVWHGFITVFGVACVLFCITGLLLLQVHARARWTVWPITGLGLLVPVLLILLFVH